MNLTEDYYRRIIFLGLVAGGVGAYLFGRGLIGRGVAEDDLEGRVQERTGELAEAYSRLQEREARYRSVFDSNVVGIFFWDVRGGVTRANDAFLGMLGYTREDLPRGGGLDWREITPGEYGPRDDGTLAEVLEKGSSEPFEKEYLRKDGSRVPVLLAAALLEGHEDRGVCLVVDLTEHKEAEEALKESEERFRRLSDALAEGIAVSENGRIVDANKSLLQMFGYELEDLKTTPALDLVPPEGREELAERLSSGNVEPYEARGLKKDGTVFPIEFRPRWIPYRGRQMRVTSVLDLTERKRNNDALRFSAEASAVLSSSLDYGTTLTSVARLAVPHLADWAAVDMVEDDGSIRRLSVAHEDPKKVALARELQERYPPDPAAAHGVPHVLRTGEPELGPEITDELPEASVDDAEHLALMRELGLKSYVIVPLTARGRTFGAITLVTAESGRRYGPGDLEVAEDLARRAALAVDNARLYEEAQGEISERERAEEALKDSEERFRSLVQNASDIISILEVDGTIRYESPAIKQVLGYGSEELVGKNAFDYVHPEDAEQVMRLFTESLDKGTETASEEFRFRHADGSWRYLEGVGNNLSEDPAVGGVVVNTRDVTERKKAEEEMEGLVEELQRSNAELEQFAYVASHDLQEPLRMVSSYTKLLARRYSGQLDADADEFIGYAVDGATRMQTLINDLLYYSRVNTRGRPLVPIDANTAFEAARDNLLVAIGESGAEVNSGSLPTVVGDQTQLVQLFQNLIGNAMKFGIEGRTPEVRVQAERLADAGAGVGAGTGVGVRKGARAGAGEWLFSVRDNGIGIEEQYRERVFVIFQRLHTREDYAGTGIGLAVCKKIVERHGGRIWVESSGVPGEGSTFYFTLRAIREEK